MNANRTLYLLESLGRYFTSNVMTSAKTMLSLLISFVFPLLVFQFDGFVRDQLSSNRFYEPAKLAGVNISGFQGLSFTGPENVEDSQYLFLQIPNLGSIVRIVVDGSVVQHPSTYLSKDSLRVFKVPILRGRYFQIEELNEDFHVCILTHSMISELRLSVDVGDAIEVNGWKYRVIGITDAGLLQNYIIFPISSYLPLNGPSGTREASFFLRLREEYSDDIERSLYAAFEASYPDAHIELWSYESFDSANENRANNVLVILFFAAFLVYLYTLSNLSGLILLEFQRSRFDIGVKLSFGATFFHICLEYFLRYLLISMLSAVILGMLIPIINVVLEDQIGYVFRVYDSVLWGLFTFPIITSAGITMFIHWHLKRLGIKQVLHS